MDQKFCLFDRSLIVILFATPKKRTSKAKTKARFSHWLKKPQKMLQRLISAGRNQEKTTIKKKLGFGLGFGGEEREEKNI